MGVISKAPHLYVIAGPNGSGKTTFAKVFLPRFANCEAFVNADLIASGLSPFSPEKAALQAGKLSLHQIDIYSKAKISFGFETTLSGVTYAALLRKLKSEGFIIHLFFLWIPTVKLALARVRERVRRGGHDIPEAVVRRRFYKGITNFFKIYQPLLNSWILFDNSEVIPSVIAEKLNDKVLVNNKSLYQRLLKFSEA